MSANPPNPKSADDRNLVTVDENYTASGLDDRLSLFWEKNSKAVLAVVALLALLIIGNETRKYLGRQHDTEIADAYGAASTDAALKGFVAAHPDEPQAGLAQLRLADSAYSVGNYAEARGAYEQAVTRLSALPEAAGRLLIARARLGAAVASLLAGQTAEAGAALKKIADDASLPHAVRAEAMFDLATQAAAAGHPDEVRSLGAQILKTDPAGPWNERVRSLLSRPVTAGATTPARSDTAPAVSFPLPGK